jgi:predicted anti-sigma-YlaC factor YlaD
VACREYEAKLHELEEEVEGRLASSAKERVTAHLEQCAACRADVEAAQLAGAMLRAALEPAGEVSGAFWTRLRAHIRSEEDQKRKAGEFLGTLEWVTRRLAWSAALVLVLMAGYVVGTGNWSVDTTASAESRELFPDPVQQPQDRDEVLLTLASSGPNGR